MTSDTTQAALGATYTAPSRQSPVARPLSPSERNPLVDVLRGVAILGVLVAYTFWNLGSPPRDAWTTAERILDTTTDMLVDGKFVTIFAFLFGVGTAQQWRRIEASGQSPAALHFRRMLFLLAAGLLHATLLRNGDILAPYAILGLMLFAVRHWPIRRIVSAIVLLNFLPYVVQLAVHAAGWKFADRPGGDTGATWYHYWADNLRWLRFWYLTNPLLSWPHILGVMLAGVIADRTRFMTRVAESQMLARRMLAISLPIAAAARAALMMVPQRWDPQHAMAARGIVLNQLYYVAAWSLAAVYIAAFARVCQRPGWTDRLAWLRAVGRMAFTNYLVQAIVVMPVCLAFGLFDSVTLTIGAALALGVMAIEIPFSVWWLNRFRYGPVEWLWRRATYGATFARAT